MSTAEFASVNGVACDVLDAHGRLVITPNALTLDGQSNIPADLRLGESLAAFLAKKAEFDALLAELTQASADHFGADPEEVLWGEAAWLSDATAKLKDIADQHFRRGEYDL